MLVTGAGLGHRFVAGSATVYNTALGIFPPGQVLGGVGNAIVGPPAAAAALSFAFTQPHVATPATSVRFTFGGAQLQSSVGIGAQTQYGLTTLTNAAQGIFPPSLVPPVVPVPLVYPGSYQFYALDFTETSPAWPAQNVAFHFGGVIVIGACGLASLATGSHEVEAPLSTAQSGIDSLRTSTPRISEAQTTGRHVAFNFVDPLDGTTRLDFGDLRPVTRAGLGDSTQFGSQSVANVAQGVFPLGLTPLPTPVPWVYIPGFRLGRLEFSFLSTAASSNAQNIGLYFSTADSFAPAGLHSLAFGASRIANWFQYASPAGFDSARTNTQLVIARSSSFPRTLYPFGSRMTQWGDLTSQQSGVFPVYPKPWATTGFGQPMAYNSDQYLIVDNEGARYTEFGAHEAYIPPPQFAGVTSIPPTQYGAVRVEHWIRWVEQRAPHAGPAVGNQRIVLRTQTVRVPWNDFSQHGKPRIEYLPDLYVEPGGIDSLYLPRPTLNRYTQYAFVSGLDSTQFGDLPMRHVQPVGFLTERWGSASIPMPYAKASGWSSLQMGAVRLPFIKPAGFVATQFGHVVVLPRRIQGFAATQWGTLWASNARRYLQQYHPIGFDPTQFGVSDVDYGLFAAPPGLYSLQSDFQRIAFRVRPLSVQSRSESLEFGVALVFSSRQYVLHGGYMWELEGTKWGGYSHVFNANRAVTPPGLNSLRIVPYHLIENTARALLTHPVAQLTFGIDTFIAHRVRRVHVQGDDSFRTSNFGNLVHNAARVLKQWGDDGVQLGVPERVESNLQAVKQHSGSTEAFGTAFVADAVRSVAVLPRLSAAHRVGPPSISLFEQFVAFSGVAPPPVGAPVVLGPYRRTITPRWPAPYLHGTARIWNKTPQLYPPGRPYTEFGARAWASELHRNVVASGISSQYIGAMSIVYRTKTVKALGRLTFENSPWGTAVRNALPDPPSTRTVVAAGGGPSSRFGAATLNCIFAYPHGIGSLVFGEADATQQGAVLRMYYPMTQWGGIAIAHWRQRVLAEMFPSQADIVRGKGDRVTYGEARVSPHTIWATETTPAQAQRNHPGNPFAGVDNEIPQGSGASRRPWFGYTTVANRHRLLFPSHTGSTEDLKGAPKFGETVVANKTAEIRPEGKLSLLFAYPTLLPHTKGIWPIGRNSAEFGDAHIAQEREMITTNNLASLAFGTPVAESRNREVYPSSYSATQWGDNNPMVHYPRRFSIGNYDATVFGSTWASHRIRYVEPAGETMTQADWVNFRDRMIVRLRRRPVMQGFDAAQVGCPAVANKQQFVAPYMIPPPCIPCQRAEVRHAQV
jgi:hypothetical protein